MLGQSRRGTIPNRTYAIRETYAGFLSGYLDEFLPQLRIAVRSRLVGQNTLVVYLTATVARRCCSHQSMVEVEAVMEPALPSKRPRRPSETPDWQ